MRPSRSGAILLASACLLGSAVPAAAGATNLDTTFGAGMITFDLGETEYVDSLAVYPDGQVVVAVLSGNGSENRQLIVARFTTDGTIDDAFGPNGDGTISIPAGPNGDFNSSTAIGLQDDGKVVVAGRVNYGMNPSTMRVARLGVDGTLDDSTDADPAVVFGTGGVFETQFANPFLGDLAIQDDGKIVVVASVFETFVDDVPTIGVLRLTSTGALDTGFDGDAGNGNGKVKISLGDGTSDGESVAIAPSGEIVVAGSFRPTGDVTPIAFALARLRATDGTLDTTFHTDGLRTRLVGEDDAGGRDMLVLPDGRILVGGFARQASDSVMAFAQFRANGTNDPSFGSAGIVLVDVAPGFDSLSGIARTGGGRIVAAGTVSLGGFGAAVGAVRLAADGTLDLTFDGDGKATAGFELMGESVQAMALGPGGRIVFGGLTAIEENNDVFDSTLGQLLSTGAPDPAYGPAGTVATRLHRFEGASDRARGVAVAANGRIVAAGTADVEDSWLFGIVRLMPTGSPDLSFGHGGRQTVDFGVGDDRANDVAVTATGQVVAVGCHDCNGTTPDFAVARLRADGIPDPAFSLDGQVATTFGTGLSEVANAVAVQTNGRIVVAGTVNGDFAVVRYLTTGARDTSFDVDGRVTTDLNAGSLDEAQGVAIQADGRIVVVGSRRIGDVFRFAVVRYLSTGALDTSFSSDGKLVTTVGANNSGAMDVAIDSQGRLVVVGDAFIGTNTSPQVALARYLPTGALDNAFSGDGRLTDGYGVEAALGRGVAVQPNDRVVVAGFTIDVVDGTQVFQELLIARYTSGGIADASFGAGGHDRAFPRGAPTHGMDVAREPSGRFVVVGDVPYVDEFGANVAFAFARFDP